MLVGGVIALALAVGAYFLWRHQRRSLKEMTLAETLTAGDLKSLASAAAEAAGAGAFSHRCELVGKAQAGPQGLAKAPESGEECVWYRTKVTEHYWEWDRDSDGDRRRVERTRTIAQHESEEPFVLTDATGTVTLSPRDADLDEPVKVLDRLDRDQSSSGAGGILETLAQGVFDWGDRTIGLEREEWVVRPGQRLYVLGEAHDDGGQLGMRKGEGGRYVISLRSEEELKKSAGRWATAAAVATVALAVAGLGLVIAGLLA